MFSIVQHIPAPPLADSVTELQCHGQHGAVADKCAYTGLRLLMLLLILNKEDSSNLGHILVINRII